MSYQATNWAWAQKTESSGQKLVLLAIADACGGDEDDPRICWPSVKRISKLTGLGDSTVRLHMEKLVELGLLTKVERRVRANGTLGTWTLTVNFQTADPSAVETADPSAHRDRRPIGAHEPESKEPEKRTSVTDDAFSDFWSKYPTRQGSSKVAARKSWKKIAPDDHLALMLGLSLWVKYWEAAKTEAQFIPHAATWLNQRRWENPPEARVHDGAVGGPRWDERRKIWLAPGVG